MQSKGDIKEKAGSIFRGLKSKARTRPEEDLVQPTSPKKKTHSAKKSKGNGVKLQPDPQGHQPTRADRESEYRLEHKYFRRKPDGASSSHDGKGRRKRDAKGS